MLHFFLIFLGVLIILLGLFTLGLVIPPRRYRPHPVPGQPSQPQPLRPDLPPPVRRHYTETVGSMPLTIHSAVIWGRGRACMRGVWVPFRFRSWYRPGDSFYRRMEITWFQRPVLRGIDYYRNGEGMFSVGEREELGPRIDQGQALELWADSVWMPSILIHPSPAKWEQVDDDTSRLIFPFHDKTESLQFHFDPNTGRMTHITGRRFSSESTIKEPWRLDLLEWKTFQGMLIPSHVSVAWGEAGSPWSYWNLDGVAYNVNVKDYLG